MNAPRDQGKNHQWVLPGSSKVESIEPGTVISRAEKCQRKSLGPMMSFLVRL